MSDRRSDRSKQDYTAALPMKVNLTLTYLTHACHALIPRFYAAFTKLLNKSTIVSRDSEAVPTPL